MASTPDNVDWDEQLRRFRRGPSPVFQEMPHVVQDFMLNLGLLPGEPPPPTVIEARAGSVLDELDGMVSIAQALRPEIETAQPAALGVHAVAVGIDSDARTALLGTLERFAFAHPCEFRQFGR